MGLLISSIILYRLSHGLLGWLRLSFLAEVLILIFFRCAFLQRLFSFTPLLCVVLQTVKFGWEFLYLVTERMAEHQMPIVIGTSSLGPIVSFMSLILIRSMWLSINYLCPVFRMLKTTLRRGLWYLSPCPIAFFHSMPLNCRSNPISLAFSVVYLTCMMILCLILWFRGIRCKTKSSSRWSPHVCCGFNSLE